MVGKVVDFLLHVGMTTRAHQPDRLECLCRYIPRSATPEQRLECGFNIDIVTCGECGGIAKAIARSEDLVVIEKIFTHLNKNGLSRKRPVTLMTVTTASAPLLLTSKETQPTIQVKAHESKAAAHRLA